MKQSSKNRPNCNAAALCMQAPGKRHEFQTIVTSIGAYGCNDLTKSRIRICAIFFAILAPVGMLLQGV